MDSASQMKTLDRHIINQLDVVETSGKRPQQIRSVSDDSRKIEAGDIFIAVKGPVTDGHQYILQAIEKGAALIVAEDKAFLNLPVPVLLVKNARKARAVLASWFYGNPSSKIKLIGITGTNGKTSIATILYRLFTQAGYPSGLISTIENIVGDRRLPAQNTTPGILELNRLLAEMYASGVAYVFMEVSSHGIDQGRIEGIEFAGGVFTNLTHEHLDYHQTFIAYRDTKKKFFDQLPPHAFALVNKDDKNGTFMLQNTQAAKYTYALKSPADYKGQVLEMDFEGMLLRINQTEFWTPLTGLFNASNLTAVFGTAQSLGMEASKIAVELSKIQAPAGRFERIISPGGKVAVIDYAHTPDALQNVLKTIKEIAKGKGQIITVVGAGGDRDKAKRPEMARVAARYSDWVILTSDNPRTEDPGQIIADMLTGVDVLDMYKTLTIPDRSEAIKAAERYAKPGDIILIAGKGHENYQIIGNEKKHFSDKEEILKHFNR